MRLCCFSYRSKRGSQHKETGAAKRAQQSTDKPEPGKNNSYNTNAKDILVKNNRRQKMKRMYTFRSSAAYSKLTPFRTNTSGMEWTRERLTGSRNKEPMRLMSLLIIAHNSALLFREDPPLNASPPAVSCFYVNKCETKAKYISKSLFQPNTKQPILYLIKPGKDGKLSLPATVAF